MALRSNKLKFVGLFGLGIFQIRNFDIDVMAADGGDVIGAEVAELGIVGESEYVVAFLNIEYAQSKFYMSLGGFAALKPLARRFLRIIHVGVNRWCIGY